MANKLQLWVSPETGKLLASPSSFVSAPRQVFYAGDTIELEVHLVQGVGVARVPYEVDFPAGADLKVSIGTVATAPTGGNWRMSVSSTETTDLAYNATPASIQSALNAIGAVAAAGGVTVIALGGGYSITWNTVGTKPDILAGSDTLVPSSYQSIYVLQEGNATQQEIVFVELRQSPLAMTDSFSSIGTPVVSSTVVSAWNGNNKVVRVSIDPIPRSGTYIIEVDGDSVAIPAYSNQGQILALLSSAGITSVSSVTQSGVLTFDIVLTADVVVNVSGTGLIASPAKVGTISLSTSELIAFLGSDATKESTIEVSVTAAGETRTLAQVACVVANAVVAPGAVSPVPVGVILTEAVANARYIRRDAAQSPSSADLDIIWPNLGVSLDGSDTAAAISGANTPSAGNPFATIADTGNPFDQNLNTTDSVVFAGLRVNGETSTSTFKVADLSNDYLTINAAGVLNSLESAAFGGTGVSTSDPGTFSISGGAPDTILSFTSLTFQGTQVLNGSTLSLTDGVNTLSVDAAAGITFPDTTVQDTRVVREQQANGGGFNTGNFDTVHYPYEVKVIDDTGTAYWVPARLA